jgi:hypothetical protein
VSQTTASDSHRVKHLELIQAVITRMGQNSFTVRGWSVTLVSVVFALIAAKDAPPLAALIALVPAVVFWGLDAYYLRQERLYQAVVADLTRATAHIPMLSMDIGPYTATVPTWRATLFSRTVVPIPAVLAAIAAGYTLTATLL